MYLGSEFTKKKAVDLANDLVYKKSRKKLSNLEVAIICICWEPKMTYKNVAEKTGYAAEYINNDVAPTLWKTLTEIIKVKVNKSNFINVLEQEWRKCNTSVVSPDYFYIEPPNIERCYQEISKPGGFLRIRGAQKTGKTLLLEHILSFARQKDYQTVKLDFKQADASILADYETFLRWLCMDISENLEIEDKVDKYWRAIRGLNRNCTYYLKKYLLPTINTPIVFALDNFELLFEYPELFENFCRLLRGWHENSKSLNRVADEIWKQLRLVLVHSTELYRTLDTNHSPFNIGLRFEVPDFTRQQVEAIIQQHELNEKVGEQGLSQLMALIEGHPYLIMQVLAALQIQKNSLEEILSLASKDQGIFRNHLHELLWNLQLNPQLEAEFQKVVMASEPVELETEIGFKLDGLGLVKYVGNGCFPYCKLYRQYFSMHLKKTEEN